ncbi:MAG: DUF4230 domain-containing protein [Blautia sp.]
MKKKIASVFAVVGMILLVLLGIMAGRYLESRKHKEPEISISSISTRLSELSELATAQLEYRGLIRYEEGTISFLTKKGFTMIYDASIKAGIDLSEAQAEIFGNTITITLPPAEIQDITINPDSLEFYDEKIALFNPDNKEDTVTALQYAKEDAEKNAAQKELLTTAETQAQLAIRKLLTPLTENTYEIVFMAR